MKRRPINEKKANNDDISNARICSEASAAVADLVHGVDFWCMV